MYQRVGSYDGALPLERLAQRLASFDMAWAPDGHGTTVDHLGPVGEAVPELKRFIPGEWCFSMLVGLRGQGGNVPVHSDLPPGGGEGLLRYHLVLQTNDRCWNLHDGDWQQLELGGIYTMDASKEHASINWGSEDRVHLVIDAVPSLAGVR